MNQTRTGKGFAIFSRLSVYNEGPQARAEEEIVMERIFEIVGEMFLNRDNYLRNCHDRQMRLTRKALYERLWLGLRAEGIPAEMLPPFQLF